MSKMVKLLARKRRKRKCILINKLNFIYNIIYNRYITCYVVSTSHTCEQIFINPVYDNIFPNLFISFFINLLINYLISHLHQSRSPSTERKSHPDFIIINSELESRLQPV